MLQQFLRKAVLTTAAVNAPLLFDRLYHLGWYRETLQDWISGLPIPPGAKILELGCGPGNLSAALAQMNYSVTGADKSPRMIRRAAKIKTNAEFIQADALHLPMQNDAFDTVVLASLINVVPDRKGLLKEVHRVLKPNGMISVLFPTLAFDSNEAERIATQRNLGPISAAALSVWATAGKKLNPADIGDELSKTGFSNGSTELYLENNIASVRAYKTNSLH